MPLLTQIARIAWFEDEPAHLLPDTLICRDFHTDRIGFRVMNYRTNYSTCFSADVDVNIDIIINKPDVKVTFFLSRR